MRDRHDEQNSTWRGNIASPRGLGFTDRALYVIDGDGMIWYSQVSPFLHHNSDIYELFDALDALKSGAAEPHDQIGVSSWSPYGRHSAPPDIPIVVYRTRWYAATHTVRRHLERLGVPYRIRRPGRGSWCGSATAMVDQRHASHPTVYVGGEVLVEPTLGELDWALSWSGVR